MTPTRKRKLKMLVGVACIIAVATGLLLYALRQNISLFYTPTQIAEGQGPLNLSIRVGGMVEKGSVIRDPQDLTVHFKITDFNKTIGVIYRGILPDLFREGQGIVAQGSILNNYQFQAKEVLAKHDENYMPPEVKDALSRVGNKKI